MVADMRVAGDLPAGLALFDPGWHQGIVGILSGRLKERVHRPVVACAPEAEGSPMLKGSARSIPGLHIRDVLAHVDAGHPGLVEAFGGHAMAAGLTLAAGRLAEFEAALERSVERFLDGEAPSAVRTSVDSRASTAFSSLESTSIPRSPYRSFPQRPKGPWASSPRNGFGQRTARSGKIRSFR